MLKEMIEIAEKGFDNITDEDASKLSSMLKEYEQTGREYFREKVGTDDQISHVLSIIAAAVLSILSEDNADSMLMLGLLGKDEVGHIVTTTTKVVAGMAKEWQNGTK